MNWCKHTVTKVVGVVLYSMVYILIRTSLCRGQDAEQPPCNPAECKLPDCLCASTKIPQDLTLSETPMLVSFTFDDAVNHQVYNSLMHLFRPTRMNPNGAPISMTLFISHVFTNHCQVAEFYRAGHEIASHSITHRLPMLYWKSAPYDDYDLEIDGQRSLLTSLAGIKREDIRAYRSPFIQPGGNTQFQVLMDRNFTYDSSLLISTPFDQDRVWPYTLDFPRQTPCQISPCPTKKFPGLWELPIQPIPDHTGTLCSFLDRCMETMSRDEIYGYLFASFNSSYHRNKAPLIINMHAYWYDENPNGTIAFDDFIQDLVNMNDVYVITSNQVVEWMKKPTKLADLHDFEPFKFVNRTTRRCSNAISREGQRRKIKANFEPYETKLKEMYSAHRPADGGRSAVLVTLFLFVAAFVYLQIKDTP